MQLGSGPVLIEPGPVLLDPVWVQLGSWPVLQSLGPVLLGHRPELLGSGPAAKRLMLQGPVLCPWPVIYNYIKNLKQSF